MFLLCFWFVLCFAFVLEVLEVCVLPFVVYVLDLDLQLSLVKFTFCCYLLACVSCVWTPFVKQWQCFHYLHCWSASAATVKKVYFVHFFLLLASKLKMTDQLFLAQKHCSWSVLSVAPPWVLWLSDIILNHHATHSHHLWLVWHIITDLAQLLCCC